jgi:hypothetical protein
MRTRNRRAALRAAFTPERALSHCVGVVRERPEGAHAEATEKEDRERGKRGPEGSPAELVNRPQVSRDAWERYPRRTDLVRPGGHGRAFYAHCRPVDHPQRVATVGAEWGRGVPIARKCRAFVRTTRFVCAWISSWIATMGTRRPLCGRSHAGWREPPIKLQRAT